MSRLWITNHPKPLKGMWSRRVGCEYIEGEPKGTDSLRVEELKQQGYIGVYVEMEADDYFMLPVAKNPKEFEALSKALSAHHSLRTDEQVLLVSRANGGRPLREPGLKGGCYLGSGAVPHHGWRCKKTPETCDLQ